jgi:hypothetical protein
MKKAGRFGKYGEEKRRQRANVKQRAEGGTGKDTMKAQKRRRKKDR